MDGVWESESMNKKMSFYCIVRIADPAVPLKRLENDAFYCDVPIPIPDHLVVFCLGELTGEKGYNVKLTYRDAEMQLGIVNKSNSCLVWNRVENMTNSESILCEKENGLAKLVVQKDKEQSPDNEFTDGQDNIWITSDTLDRNKRRNNEAGLCKLLNEPSAKKQKTKTENNTRIRYSKFDRNRNKTEMQMVEKIKPRNPRRENSPMVEHDGNLTMETSSPDNSMIRTKTSHRSKKVRKSGCCENVEESQTINGMKGNDIKVTRQKSQVVNDNDKKKNVEQTSDIETKRRKAEITNLELSSVEVKTDIKQFNDENNLNLTDDIFNNEVDNMETSSFVLNTDRHFDDENDLDFSDQEFVNVDNNVSADESMKQNGLTDILDLSEEQQSSDIKTKRSKEQNSCMDISSIELNRDIKELDDENNLNATVSEVIHIDSNATADESMKQKGLTEVLDQRDEQLNSGSKLEETSSKDLTTVFHTCAFCKTTFTSANSCVQHLILEHGIEELKDENIQILDSWLNQNGQSSYRMDTYNESRKVILSESYNNKKINSATLTNIVVEKPYQCDVSGHALKSKKDLIFHKRIHTGDKPYKCEVPGCGRTFRHSCSLSKHKKIHAAEKQYKCDVPGCGYASYFSYLLTSHKKVHSGEKPYKCDVCGHTFSESSNLNQHKRIHTGEKPYKCDVCGVSFKQLGHLNSHTKIHTGEKLYVCDICGYACSHKSSLTSHKRIHTGEKPYKCDVCGWAFHTSCNLASHKRKHIGEKPYICDVCGRGFGELNTLTRHKRTHTGEKPYKCDVCGHTFSLSSLLTIHKTKHLGEKQYKCDLCGHAFSLLSHLTSHKTKHCCEQQYKCDVCEHVFSNVSSLTVHKIIHTGEKPYKCDECGHAFKRLGHLKSHLKIHSGEKPYMCDMCGYACKHKSALMSHKRTHTAEKPYKCDVCGHAFSQSSGLANHKRKHTGEKPYVCDVCGRGFGDLGTLTRHKRIVHIREKPYKCDVCGHAFRLLRLLTMHKRVHSGEKPYRCDVCGCGFAYKSSLVRHGLVHTEVSSSLLSPVQ